MSSIGKIFVVLNLVLAAAFVGWAANAVNLSGEWRKKHDDLVVLVGKEKMELNAELTKVRADLGLTKADLQTAVSTRDEAKRAQDRLTAEKSDLQNENEKLNTAVQSIQTTLGEINAARTKAEEDAKKALLAQASAEKAQREAELAQQKAESDKSAAENMLRETQTQVANLEKDRTKLINETGSLQTSLDTIVANTGVNVLDFANVPKIDGAVLGIDTSVAPGLVAINAGKDQGVKRGHTFEIFDGGTYKGQVRIEFVHGDMASGLITRTVPGQTIRQGDNATTRL